MRISIDARWRACVELSASTPPTAGVRVGDRVDAGDRALEHGQRAGGDVAVAAAAVAVAREAQHRALRRDRAVLRPAAVGLADRRAELDLAARRGRA